MERLEEIKERLGRITPGPWRWGDWWTSLGDFEPARINERRSLEVNPRLDEHAGVRERDDWPRRILKVDEESEPRPEDMKFIASAPQDIEYLLDLAENPDADEAIVAICDRLDDVIFPNVGTAWINTLDSRLEFLLSYVEDMKAVIGMQRKEMVIMERVASGAMRGYNAVKGGDNEQEHSDNCCGGAGHPHHDRGSGQDG